MQIKDIMSKIVIAVSPETPLKDVTSKMQQQDCGCIVSVCSWPPSATLENHSECR
jgi:hypothetical protein